MMGVFARGDTDSQNSHMRSNMTDLGHISGLLLKYTFNDRQFYLLT